MPRLTTQQYVDAHAQLNRFWLTNDGLFAELTPTEQWQLHDYFQPSKDWTERQLLEHREAISATRPSLPQQAGRALSKLRERAAFVAVTRVRAAKAPRPAGPRKGRQQGDRVLTVKAVVKPEIDIKALARAFVNVARDIAKRRHERLGETALRGAGVGPRPNGGTLSPDLLVTLRAPHTYDVAYWRRVAELKQQL